MLVIGGDVDVGDRGVDRIPEVERTAGLFFSKKVVGTVGEDLGKPGVPGDEGECFFKRPVHQAAGGAPDRIRWRHCILYPFLRRHASAATAHASR